MLQHVKTVTSVDVCWSQESYHKVKYDRPGECSPEKDCLRWHWLRFRQPERKSSSESSDLCNVSRYYKNSGRRCNWSTYSWCYWSTVSWCYWSTVSQLHLGSTDSRPITSRISWPITSTTGVFIVSTDVTQITWLWRWLPLRLSKRQSMSSQTVLLRTTLTRTIVLYFMICWSIRNVEDWNHLKLCVWFQISATTVYIYSYDHRSYDRNLSNCLNCDHNCDDHSLHDFKPAVQYMKNFIYHFTVCI